MIYEFEPSQEDIEAKVDDDAEVLNCILYEVTSDPPSDDRFQLILTFKSY